MAHQPDPTALQTRQAAFQPKSLNPKTRTVDLIWSTGARVLRRDYQGSFWEELSMDPSHVHLERLNNGAPLLDSHSTAGGISATLGVVERASISQGQGVATVRFPAEGISTEADKAFRLVQDGITQNVSCGYTVSRFEEAGVGADKIPVYRAVSWTPAELSLCPMGADPGAQVRDFRSQLAPTGARKMSDEVQNTEAQSTPDPTATERTRVLEIRKATRIAKLEDTFADRFIAKGTSMPEFRAALLDEIATRSEAFAPDENAHVLRVEFSQRGDMDDLRAAASDAVLMRAGIKVEKPHPAAVDLRSSSIHDIARACISRAGKSHKGASNAGLIERAFSTSDFPQILLDATHKSMRQGYELEPASHREWVREETVPDFRSQFRPILGSAPALDEVLELGEYTQGSMLEDSTSYKVSKFGRVVSLSREMLVNDNLNAFIRVQPALGQAARRKEADLVYAMLAENTNDGPTMQDSHPLFDATNHANVIGTPGALVAATVGEARSLLRKQQAVGGGYLSLVPVTLLVPAELETDAEVMLAAATRIQLSGDLAADQTPAWVSKLRIVVEPRLAADAFYLIASFGQIDHAVLGILDNAWMGAGPTLEQDMSKDFSRDEIRWKVRHTFGTKFLDWRGIVKCPTS